MFWPVLSNWKLKVFSIAMAIFIWNYVRNQPHEIEPNPQEDAHEEALLRDALRECGCPRPSEVPP